MVRTWFLLTAISAVLAGCAQTSITPTTYHIPAATPTPVAREERSLSARGTELSLAPQAPVQTPSPASKALREQAPIPRGPTLQQPPLAPLEALTPSQGPFVLRQPGEQEAAMPLPLGSAQTQSAHRLDTEPNEKPPTDALQYGEKVPLVIPAPPPNEVSFGKTKFSGILVEFSKAPHPLQLLNPFATGNYSPEDNVVRDPKGNISGLKAFAVGF